MSHDTQDNEWAESTVTRLRELWSEGHSTAEIGRRLGVSKNAVVGKAHRLDLPARPSPIGRAGPSGPRPPRPPKAIPKLADIVRLPSCAPTPREPVAAVRHDPPPVHLARVERRDAAVSRSRTCCWPIGNPGQPGFRFCEAPALVAKPYCKDHADQAYRPFRRRDGKQQDAAAAYPQG